MSDHGKYLGNYVFEVRIGLFTLSFSKISNISSELECETFGDGGNNERMYFFEKSKRKPDRIRFEKGLKTGVADTILSLIFEGLKVNDIMILVKRDGSTQKVFFIEQAMIVKRSFSDLDAMKGEVMVKSLELLHTGLVEVSL